MQIRNEEKKIVKVFNIEIKIYIKATKQLFHIIYNYIFMYSLYFLSYNHENIGIILQIMNGKKSYFCNGCKKKAIYTLQPFSAKIFLKLHPGFRNDLFS